MQVRLVTRTTVVEDFLEATIEEIGEELTADLIQTTPEALCVYIARVSSDRENKWEAPEKLVRYLIVHKHWSPFEHAFLTFEVVTSRAIATQMIRHRSAYFQQFSQRYADSVEIEPIEIRLEAESNRQSSTEVWMTDLQPSKHRTLDTTSISFTNNLSEYFEDPDTDQFLENVLRDKLRLDQLVYRELRDRGVASECARFFLPLGTQTTLYMTGPLRTWIHFLQVRDDEHAQKEVELIAKEMKVLFGQECPVIAETLRNIDAQNALKARKLALVADYSLEELEALLNNA